MKKRWEEPRILVQKFMPNEYVAACGDENKVYKFKCDAPTEWGIGFVFEESNGKDGLQYRPISGGGDKLRGSYHPCGEEHDAPVTDAFRKGYYVHDLESVFNATPIIIWTGLNDDNTHCTRNLDMNSWTTEKS